MTPDSRNAIAPPSMPYPESQSSRIEQFVASDNHSIVYRYWPAAADRRRGTVVALHGIQSHSGWYDYSSRALCAAGWDICFLDRRGSGRDDGPRGHIVHSDRLLNDVIQFLGRIRHQRPETDDTSIQTTTDAQHTDPVVLLGLSWGAKPAAVVAARRPELIDGLVLPYPGILAKIRPTWLQRQLLCLAARFVPERRIRLPLDDPALFTSDPAAQQFIRSDPLALHDVTLQFLVHSLRLDQLSRDARERIRCPTLVMLAGNDQIIDNQETRIWFEQLTATDKQILEYPNACHTLEFEPDRAAIIGDLIDWLNRTNFCHPRPDGAVQ